MNPNLVEIESNEYFIVDMMYASLKNNMTGIAVYNGATLTMNGGQISNNYGVVISSTVRGGGIYVDANSTLNLDASALGPTPTFAFNSVFLRRSITTPSFKYLLFRWSFLS